MTAKKMTTPTNKHKPPAPVELAADAGDAGMRLDRFLSSRLDGLTRSRIQTLIRSGRVTGRAGTISDASARVNLTTGFRYPSRRRKPQALKPRRSR